MGIQKKQIKNLQIISVVVVLLFVALSAFDCINVYKESTGHSQMPIENPEDIKEPTVHTNSYNNQLLRVAIIGVVEIILIIVTCFKLSIVAAVFELLMTIGTLCTGYLEQLLAPITGGVGTPLYTVTFDITVIGCCVACIAIVNVAMTIVLQVKKKSIMKGESEYAINNNTDWS